MNLWKDGSTDAVAVNGENRTLAYWTSTNPPWRAFRATYLFFKSLQSPSFCPFLMDPKVCAHLELLLDYKTGGQVQKKTLECDIGVKNKYPCIALFFDNITLEHIVILYILNTHFHCFLIPKTAWGHFLHFFAGA